MIKPNNKNNEEQMIFFLINERKAVKLKRVDFRLVEGRIKVLRYNFFFLVIHIN